MSQTPRQDANESGSPACVPSDGGNIGEGATDIRSDGAAGNKANPALLVSIAPVGTESNRSAIGARIRVVEDAERARRTDVRRLKLRG